MATVKIWKVKYNLDYVIDYASNSEKTSLKENEDLKNVIDYATKSSKTEQKLFVNALNCYPISAYEQMQDTKEKFGKKKGILAFHSYQSFAPGEVTPEVAHEIGMKFAQQRLEQKSSANKEKPTVETPKAETKKSVADKKQQTKTKAKNVSEDKPKERSNPRIRKQSAPKQKTKREIRNVRSGDKTIKSADAGIKQSARSLENTSRQIKIAQKGTEAAKKSAEVTAKAAKKADHSARITAKATAKAAKKVAEATVKSVKATIAAVKELGALIAAGGTTAVVVIIVLCLLAAIGGTCFGIFLSNDKTTGSDMTMTQAISSLTSEHYANLTAFKEGFTYDTVEVQGDSNIEWKDVLAVYAVKTTTSEDNTFEVVTINEEKLDLLRDIMNDMNKLTGVVTPKIVAQTVVTTDEEGNSIKTTEYVTKKVLTVNIIRLSAEQIIELYNFNDEQKKQLKRPPKKFV